MGNGNSNGGNAENANVVDVSMSAVNARLRAFIAEVRARPEGEQRPFRESDALLCAMAEQALEAQEVAECKLAEAEAALERLELERGGGRIQ